jgi:hypothetical protein
VNNSLPIIAGLIATGMLKKHTGSRIRLKSEPSAEVNLHFKMRIPIRDDFDVYEDNDEIDEIENELWNIKTEETGIEIKEINFEYEDTNVVYLNLTIELGQMLQSTKMIDLYKILQNKVNEFIRIVRQFVDIKTSKRKIKILCEETIQQKSFVKKKDTIEDIYTDQRWYERYTFVKSRRPMVEFDVELSTPSELIVNADTGEIYEPSLPSKSKLRKR